MSVDRVGRYETKPFSKNRQNVSIILGESARKHSIHAPLELDVTEAREKIRDIAARTGKKPSFTGWIVACVAQALSEHRDLNAYRLGRRKIVTFEDVDVAIPIERTVHGEYRTLVYIIRKANEKTVWDITREIRAAQQEKIDEDTQVLGRNLTLFERAALNAPAFLKRFFMWLVRRRGVMKKKHMGTAGVSAIGMIGEFPGGIVPLGGTQAIMVVLGGIEKKPGVIDDSIQIREYLNATISIDHDIIDGGPLVRFISRLVELTREGYGLTEE